MDPRERVPDLLEVIREAVRSHMQGVYTSAPVEIVSFDPVTWTCTAKILTLIRHEFPVNNSAGLPVPTGIKDPTPKDKTVDYYWEEPPLLTGCPVVFLSGAGFTMFAPPQPGDEALAIFGFRSIDEWWTAGAPATRRADLRVHSASDAFILAGVRSKPRASLLPPVDPAAFEITNAAGTVGIKLTEAGVVITAGPSSIVLSPVGCAITAPDIFLNGNVWPTGDIVSSPTNGSISFLTHIHEDQGKPTGPPVRLVTQKDDKPAEPFPETGNGGT